MKALELIRPLITQADLEIRLPASPSINACYSDVFQFSKIKKHNVIRRVKSNKYKIWEKEAWITLKAHYNPVFPTPKIKGCISVLYMIPKSKGKKDCANYEKCLSDFLVSTEIIEDDSKILLNSQAWTDESEVIVYITALEG